MKKLIIMILSLSLILTTSCALAAGNINVISREDGSGTRGAFVELLGILDEDGDDATTDYAEVTNSTSVMLTTVAGNKMAIGYVSLGSLSEEVKALKVNGVEASVENVVNGSYTIARPFNICYNAELSDLAADFIGFIMSVEGQAIVSENGYISVVAEPVNYATSETTGIVRSGKISLAGSTSVAPVMEKLAEAYKMLNPQVEIEIQQSGSSAGIQSTIEGACDIGMASRELKESEIEAGLEPLVIAQDGIAVIVNVKNEIEDLTAEQIRDIFLGEIETWDEIEIA